MGYLLILTAGFALFIIGAYLLVENSSSLAKQLNIQETGLKQFDLTFVINKVIDISMTDLKFYV
jgi:hypothetical protein